MAQRIAVIDENGLVTNVVVGDGSKVSTEFSRVCGEEDFVGIGFTYDADRDAFIPPTPHPSWVLDEATCLWVAPVAYPDDGGEYVWDEETTNWSEVGDETT